MAKMFRRYKIQLIVRRYEAILVGSIVLLSGVVIPASWEPPMHLLPRPKVVLPPPAPAPRHPWIAFTFDDGPHPVMTEKLLAVLHENHVPSTFFVVGKMVERYPDIVRKMVKDGHEVGNHTFHHLKLAELPDAQVLEELNTTRDLIRQVTGKDTVLFRPPGGGYKRHTARLTAENGYRMVLWSILTDDVEGVSAASMRRRILAHADDGGIILMHSGVKETLDVLPGVITSLRKRGFQL